MSLKAFRGVLLENWGLKLLSLAFATLLWLFVVGEKRSEVSLSLPLELTRVPEDMVVVSRVPEAIRVRLNGPRTLLATVSPQKMAVTLDLDGIQPGLNAFEILPRLIVPRGVEVMDVSPSVVTLEADRQIQRAVPVRPRTRGTPAEGFEVAEVRAEPPEVEVRGPERVLTQLREVPTEVVDVGGLEGSASRPVELVLPDPTLRPLNRGSVRLVVTIREMQAEREFIEVPVGVPEGWEAIPPVVSVTVAGSLRAVSRTGSRDVSAAVEPFGEEAPRGPVRVVVRVPAGVRVVSVDPNVVELEASATPAAEGG